MPKIPYDILFHRQSLKNDCVIEDRLYRVPLALLKRAFFPSLKKVDYSDLPNSTILFYLSDPIRKSNEVNFNKVISTAPKSDTIIERFGKGTFSFLGFYLFFILAPIWFFQMCGRSLTLIEKCQILKDLVESYRIQRFFTKINVSKYSLLVCYYDSIVHECMLTLIFKKAGIKTATLQHGQFNAWRENTFVNCGLEFLASPSDFQLCWNKYAKDEAMKCGWKAAQLPVVGVMSNIGRGRERWTKPNNGIFGVVISHPSWDHENLEMIKAANILASKYGYKYFLKLHPNYREDYFGNDIKKEYCLGNTKNGIDTLMYVNMVDFTIVGSTSFFVEMVYTYHDILRYSTQLPSDKYKDIMEGSIFHKSDEIIDCYNNLNDKEKSKLFDYLCETEDTYSLYHDFFIQYA